MATGTRIFVAKEAFKFSCAHMTVFPDGTKERLHGHNYFVEVALELADTSWQAMVDFGPLKAAVMGLCAEWKERLILAERNPHFELVRQAEGELEFRLCGQRYVVPADDALLLPIDNAVVEELARHVSDRLTTALVPTFPTGAVSAIEITVTESPGQGARVRVSLTEGA